jgi:hypothetical protein
MTHPAAARTETALGQEHTPFPAPTSIREQLDATTRAVVSADEAYLREALASVHWERRGPLQRLVRRQRDAEVRPT